VEHQDVIDRINEIAQEEHQLFEKESAKGDTAE
jgi:hypothetical protein